MDERAYWIWAQHAFGAGSPLPQRLAGDYRGGLREFYEGGPKLWNTRRDIADSAAVALWNFPLAQAEARLEYAEKVGWQVLTPADKEYPGPLRNIHNPPAVLYGKGTLPDLDHQLAIAVVGSRKPLPASEDIARHLGYQLAAGGACVVSGGAKGVDYGALSGALQIPGSHMISVLPVSLDSAYILQNAKLRESICAFGGALLTEYFSQSRPVVGTFHVRNRLITGLSRGVIIVQAAEKSGSMIYASHAADQNRDLYVYPGPEGLAEFAGSRRLIEEGAMSVTSGEDVLAEYGETRRPKPRPQAVELLKDMLPVRPSRTAEAAVLEDAGAGLSPSARAVLAALGPDPLPVAELGEKTGLGPAELLGLLTELELEGLAVSHPGKRYSRP